MMASSLATKLAAQAWCLAKTKHIEMDVTLCEGFAMVLDDVLSKPWLGNATTAELIDELRARCEVNGTLSYRTVDGGQ